MSNLYFNEIEKHKKNQIDFNTKYLKKETDSIRENLKSRNGKSENDKENIIVIKDINNEESKIKI